jgi:hypothetical protein
MLIGFPVPADAISVWRHAQDGDLLVVDPQARYPSGTVYLRFYSETLDEERGIPRSRARRLLRRVPADSDDYRRACARYAEYQARQRMSAANAVALVAPQPRVIDAELAQAMLPSFEVRARPREAPDGGRRAGAQPEDRGARDIQPRDLELVMLWFDDERTTSTDPERERDDFARLLSARVAEKELARYFADAGRRVVDVSIQQVDGDAANRDWARCDLRVDGDAVDVKSARVARPRYAASSPWKRYVDHAVPR